MISTRKRYGEYVLWIVIFCVGILVDERYNIVIFPVSDIIEYQFNLFTISSVLAGFSFSVLGMFLGMFSEKMMDEIKETSIITRKSRKIVNSLILFCVSGFVSLFFIIRLDVAIERIVLKLFNSKGEIIINSIFLIGIISLLLGIIYFLIAVYEIYGLIEKVYGYNKRKKSMKTEFWNEVETVKKRRKLTHSEEEKDIFTKE